jgi:hypothetical protein
MSHPHVARPGGITLLTVLGIINGIVSIGAGLFLIFDRDDPELIEQTKLSENQLMGSGIGMIVFGGGLVLLASALGRGNNVVRWLYGIVTMVAVAAGLWGIFALHGEQQMSAGFQAVFGLIVLWILFGSERTDEFFGVS